MLEPIKQKVEIKKSFEEHFRQISPDYDLFMKYNLSYLRRSIRVNTNKISIDELKLRLKDKWTLTPVPWCEEGFWIKSDRRDVGNLPEHSLGYIYIQEAASMIPPIVLDPKPGDFILDVAASPGSKTTQIGQYLKNEGLLIANDVKADRLAPLGINIQRCGLTNVLITQMLGQSIRGFQFDKILLDAPCSGTGTIRKSLKTISMYNYKMIRKLSRIQQSLILNAYSNLKPGGTLVYSTCSVEPLENEYIVNYLLENTDAKVIPFELNIKRSTPFLEYEGKKFHSSLSNVLRIWPYDNDTEGFFVAKIYKPLE